MSPNHNPYSNNFAHPAQLIGAFKNIELLLKYKNNKNV